MNATHIPLRNALDVIALRELMFVKLNGPPVERFNAEHYATKCIKDGHHSTCDRPSGRSAPSDDTKLQHHQKLFCT